MSAAGRSLTSSHGPEADINYTARARAFLRVVCTNLAALRSPPLPARDSRFLLLQLNPQQAYRLYVQVLDCVRWR